MVQAAAAVMAGDGVQRDREEGRELVSANEEGQIPHSPLSGSPSLCGFLKRLVSHSAFSSHITEEKKAWNSSAGGQS